MGTRANAKPLGLDEDAAARKKMGCRLTLDIGAAERLISQQRRKICRNPDHACLHAIQKRAILRLGGNIHGQIRDSRADSRVPPSRLSGNECPLTHPRFNQSPALGLNIAARDRREIDSQPLGQFALRRQAVGYVQSSIPDILRNGIGDRLVMGLAVPVEVGTPILHLLLTFACDGWVS